MHNTIQPQLRLQLLQFPQLRDLKCLFFQTFSKPSTFMCNLNIRFIMEIELSWNSQNQYSNNNEEYSSTSSYDKTTAATPYTSSSTDSEVSKDYANED